MKSLRYIGILLFIALSIHAQENSPDRRESFIRAESEYQIGHIDNAIQILNKNASFYSKTIKVSAYRLLALCYLAQDDLTNANRYVDLLLKEDPYYSLSMNDPERLAKIIRGKKEGRLTLVTASQQMEVLEEAPVPVILITEEMIQAIGANNLREVLTSYVPGMTSIEGEELNVSMRGVYSYSQENILIMLNGHRLNSHSTNSVAPDYRISMENIKQIEVLRGAASSLYGNVALTAVVNIITKRGGEIDGVKATFGIGDNETYKGSLLFGKRSFDSDIALWVSIYHSRGYKYTIDQDSEDFYGMIPKDGYIYVDGYNHKPAYDFGLRYQWNDFTISLGHQYSKRVYNYNNIYLLSTYDYDRYESFHGAKPGRGNASTYANLQYTASFKNTQIDASLSVDYESENIYNIMGDTIPESYNEMSSIFQLVDQYSNDSIRMDRGVFQILDWKDITVGGELRLLQKYQWGKSHGNVIVGTQYEYFNSFNNTLFLGDNFDRIILTASNERNTTYGNGKEHSLSLYAQVKHYFTPKLIFNGGLRYDFRKRYNGAKENILSPRLSIIYLPKEQWNLKLSYSRSFVDAPFFYRISKIVYTGSPDLNPQYMDNVQLSSTVDIKPFHLVYDFNLYFNHMQDIIYLGETAYMNAGNLDMLGWENSLTYKIPHFTARGNLTYQRLLSADNYSASDDKVYGVPDFILNLVVEKELYPFVKNLWIDAKISAYTKQVTYITNKQIYKNQESYFGSEYEMPAYGLVDLGMRYSWRFLDLNIRCRNLLNKKYRLAGDRVPALQAGRSIFASLSFNF